MVIDSGKVVEDKIKIPENRILKILCFNCKCETNHKSHWIKEVRKEYANGDFWLEETDEVLSCMGCGHVTLRKTSWFSEDLIEGDFGPEPLVQITDLPKRDTRMINPKCEFHYLPTKVKKVYEETIDAYNEGILILCAIGIRTVIEAVCYEEKIAGKDLKEKIEVLATKKIITPQLAEGLHQNRLIGNASAHELQVFGESELLDAIGLIENLLEGHYAIQEKIKNLKIKLSK